jgi:glyoxylase-like metal-dependent hydrolase (beta-lactamase superfamily II)
VPDARPPSVEPLHLADVTLPEGHPLAGQPCVVQAFVIRHPDGALLVDTGVGAGHPGIERLYQPKRCPLVEALATIGLTPNDIAAVINTHLHFDHCGENLLFPDVPIYVQAAEHEAAHGPAYTIPEWVDFPDATYELLDGATDVLPGVRLLPTPGHTPGHQSVVIEDADGRVVIAGQAAYSADELAGKVAGDADGAWDRDLYLESLDRLRALKPRLVYLSHDTAVWEAPRSSP